MNKPLAVTLLCVAMAGCATVPAPLQGQFSPATPRDAASAAGQAVRWGGEIIEVVPKADATCFEILSRPLDDSARPRASDEPGGGRFIACRNGFYDPEEFDRGREMTVIGHVTGTDHGKVGDFDYAYPHVAADAVYLWPKRPRYARSPYYDPWFYGPYWGGFGPYWGPFWGGGTVIIHEHPHRPPDSRPAHH